MAPEQLLMNDRILNVNTTGGAGDSEPLSQKRNFVGRLVLQLSLFKDPLWRAVIAEGCVQLLQFYMLYLGLQTSLRTPVSNPSSIFPKLSGAEGRLSHLTH